MRNQQGGVIGDFSLNILLFGVALIINSLVLRFLIGKISPYTQQGVEARKKAEAFKKFLEDREKFRELGYTSQTFETYLPYAIAFGMDGEWLQRFQTAKTVASPIWYVPVFVDTTTDVYTNSDSSAPDLSGIFGGLSERSGSSGSSSPNISLDSMSAGIGSSLSSLSMGLGGFLNSAASAMTSAPTPVVSSFSSFSDSDSSWSGSSGSDWSSSNSDGSWSGGGDSGGGDSGGGGSDFG